jgi:uncharacterized protein (DUF4415 family)
MMGEEMSEKKLRGQAYGHRDQVVEGSGEVMEPARLSQMVSLRLDGDVIGALRDLANRRQTTVSELLRQGASLVLAHDAAPTQTLLVFDVKTETGSPPALMAWPSGQAGSPTDQGLEYQSPAVTA